VALLVVKTTAGIALRVTESHKPHHHDKVETLLGVVADAAYLNNRNQKKKPTLYIADIPAIDQSLL
jgi:hypothetical protein